MNRYDLMGHLEDFDCKRVKQKGLPDRYLNPANDQTVTIPDGDEIDKADVIAICEQLALDVPLECSPIDVDIFFWPPDVRPCDFSLRLQRDSVFADFGVDKNQRVFIVRISFDCYGCCKPDKVSAMNQRDSQRLLTMVEQRDFDLEETDRILRRYFRGNRHAIWEDALESHFLV